MGTLREAQPELARYERLLFTAALQTLQDAAAETDPPWVAVAIGYHHGLSFNPSLGVLPQSEYEESKSIFETPRARFNPAEWTYWGEAAELEDEELSSLGGELERLAVSALDGPRYGREIHVRVATKLREALLEAGLLTPDALVFATEFCQADWQENTRASNPPDACAAHGV